MLGRVTYELMAGFRPTPQAQEANPVVADRMGGLPKVVLSRTLVRASWRNTRLLQGIGRKLRLALARTRSFGNGDLVP